MSYKPELTGRWWLKHGHFKRYMLREATVIPLVFLLCSLLAGVFSLQDVERFSQWQAYMAHPLVIIGHTVALGAALYHAATFFVLFPRVMPIRIANYTLPARLMVAGQWAAVLAVALLCLWLVTGGRV
ncbi:fumarate reductase subunit C [Aliidiomarina maris]|uniref:Fumarate reductase subunit C n=1 Tax=Aliidiomarina maris TaxID=531312 RepID=A0A327WUT9_9GAMM|nr:fumarate reductase subunit C [Aliidiomarina maris]MBA3988969.1 fumarate reductase subunit C [Idiomarina sp.]RAJ96338.1 fumarate reductase subunit C [Aliidiomarina maris]RUO22884.1 fumarate reductase subunit C [Aliidiomarina maris]